MKQFKLFLPAFYFVLLSSVAPGQQTAMAKENIPSIVLSGLQMTVTSVIKNNQEQIMTGIRKAAQAGANFLVTPEGSLSGYTSNFDQSEVAGALQEIKALTMKLKVGLLLGTCYKEMKNGKEFCFNQVRVYSQEGDFMGAYSKILRCSNIDLPGTGEMLEYVEGELKTFDWNGIRFGILICNDLWATPGYTTMPNPYLPLKLKQMGARFIVHCINSGTVQKYRPFHESSAELWALSTRMPILEVNAAQGTETINARSGLINANGERIVVVPDSGLQFFTATINIANPGEETKK